MLSNFEKEAKENCKKKELESIAKQARDDYMRKMNSVSISAASGGGSVPQLKDAKQAIYNKMEKKNSINSAGSVVSGG